MILFHDLQTLFKTLSQHSTDAAIKGVYDLGFTHGAASTATDPLPDVGGTPPTMPEVMPTDPSIPPLTIDGPFGPDAPFVPAP